MIHLYQNMVLKNYLTFHGSQTPWCSPMILATWCSHSCKIPFRFVPRMICVTHRIRQKCYHVHSEISTVASILVAFSYTLSLTLGSLVLGDVMQWADLWEAHITRNWSSCQWPLEWAWKPILQSMSKSSKTSSLTNLSHNQPARALPGSWPQKPVPW